MKHKALAFTAFSWTALLTYLHGKKHAFIALNSFFIFWLYIYAEKIIYQSLPSKGLIAYMMLSVGISFLFALFYQEASKRLSYVSPALIFTLCFILYSIPLFYLIYYFTFATEVTPDVFFAIFQTTVREAFDFIKGHISFGWVALILIGSLSLSYGLYRKEKNEPEKIEVSLASFLVILSLSASYAYQTDLRIIHRIPSSIQQYKEELAKFEEVRDRVNKGKIKYNAAKTETGEVYVVVIGESLSKNHMQLYGYLRETTPKLNQLYEQGEIIRFDNAYSNHTHTMPVLSLSLTEANQINSKEYFSSASIVDIAKTAGFETVWVTNQVLYGIWDNLVSIMAHNAGTLEALNKNIGTSLKTQKNDDETIARVEKILSTMKTDKNIIIFVHLIGSHWDYCTRFTKPFARFNGPITAGDFGNFSKTLDSAKWLNCYDNSVLYNDHVVTQLLELLKQRDGVSGFIYFADHGEDVIGKKGHNSATFNYEMAEIPLLAWFSDQYNKKYKPKIVALKNNREKPFPNDLIYDTLVGLLGIQTDRYEKQYDISNKRFSLANEELSTLHGIRKYIDRDNHNYLQWANNRELKNKHLLSRIIPAGINTIGKFKNSQFDGYDSFELDLIYRNGNEGYFEVGVDSKSRIDVTLDEFLKITRKSEGQKIWLSIHNANPESLDGMVQCLVRLDKKYDLKDRVLIESKMAEESFIKLSRAGFNTSYKLSEADLQILLDEGSEKKLEKKAVELSKLIRRQKRKAVSFDHKLYPFVKKYLKKHLDAEITFHIKDLSLSLKDEKFMSRLLNQPHFKDPKVKTIRVHYHSHFSL
ncbi:MAG: hypothetical protein NPINA01_17330 [Nitrospinaceae bacterium]|nr:MAG: hypothetical protein NPINA01_17330 [Nitrospinaceae bacterium]